MHIPNCLQALHLKMFLLLTKRYYQPGISSPKRMYSGKRKGLQPVHTDIASHMHAGLCAEVGKYYIKEKEVKGRGSYSHRTLPIGFLQLCRVWWRMRTSISPSSSHRSSQLIVSLMFHLVFITVHFLWYPCGLCYTLCFPGLIIYC